MSAVTFIPCIAVVGGIPALKSRRARTVVKRTPYGASALRARVRQVSSGRSAVKVQALMDDKDAKKMPTRKEEPDEFWRSEAEKEGKSVFSDPMAIAAISAILVPLLILGIAIGTGYVELNN